MTTLSENIRETIEIGPWIRTGPQVRYGMTASPFGTVIIATVNGKLGALSFCDDEAQGIVDLARKWPGAVLSEDAGMAKALGRRIFANGRTHLPEEGLVLIGTTFQIDVWRGLIGIPAGTTVTYTRLATALGRPSAIRAVASAVGRNSLAILVPCHRVIGAGGRLGGYRWGIARKQAIIDAEASRQAE